ncbi:hypothetical protein HU230_0010700 [Bradyrhizobium quebecense]|uniref:Uncharacterized protein n=1 Tax=Bradyrhizobium quebecense TaxID=2748629 RepID=A0A974AH32_9BRAD|nr:hypothetical protein [Bradyrhizobium quebecense]UGA46472.1 hypothetical protein HU230_0010700 [Bradyrhizobium quebecense]
MAVIAVPKMFRDGEHHRSQRQSAPRIFNRGIEIDVEADPNGGYPGKHYRNSAAALFSQIVRFTAFLLIELIGRFVFCARSLSMRPARCAQRRMQILEIISQERSFDGAIAGAESLSF